MAITGLLNMFGVRPMGYADRSCLLRPKDRFRRLRLHSKLRRKIAPMDNRHTHGANVNNGSQFRPCRTFHEPILAQKPIQARSPRQPWGQIICPCLII